MCVKYSTVVNVVKGFKGKTCVTRFGEMFFLNWAILASLFKYLWKMKSTLTIFHSCQWPPNIEQTIWPSAHTVWLNHRQDSMGTVEMKGYSAPLEYTCAACWTKKLKLRMDFLSAKNFTFQSKLSRILVPTMTTVFFSLQSVCYTHCFEKLQAHNQCDRMARLFFNVWPFTSLKICPMQYKICQRRSKIFPNSKQTLKNWAFCQSGEFRQIWSHCTHLMCANLIASDISVFNLEIKKFKLCRNSLLVETT